MQNTQQLAKLLDDLIQGGRHQGLGPQLAYSAIENGKLVENDEYGVTTSTWGKQYDGTHVNVTLVGPAPPVPVAPSLTTLPGSLEIRWSGKFVGLSVSPLDFKHVSVHVSQISGFSPDSSNQKATIRGELGDIATMVIQNTGIYYVKLVSWTLAGKASAASDEVSVTLEAPVDPTWLNESINAMEADITLAKSDASAAQVVAGNAATTAATAQTKADTAKTTADNAATSAASAVGIALSKSRVLIQPTTPAAEDQTDLVLWIDTTSNLNKPKRWSGTSWIAVTDKVATDAAAAAVAAQTAATNAATKAQAAQDTAENAIADALAANTAAGNANSAAMAASGLAASKGRTIYLSTAPTGVDADAKNLWIRTTDNKPHIYINSVWTAVTDKAATDAASAAAAANSLAASKITTFYGNTAPTATATGDLWLDSSAGNALKRWNGSAWAAVDDAKLQEALTKAGDAQATADGKIRTHAQTTAPTGLVAKDVGDIWLDTDEGNKMWRWSGTAWVAVQDTSIATAKSAADAAAQAASDAAGIANGKGKVLVQSTAPLAADRNNVTLWIDTTNNLNTPKRWTTGTTWVAVTDKAATDAAAAAATAASAAATAQAAANAAQAKADQAFSDAGVAAQAAGDAMTSASGKSTNWYQTSAPAGLLHREGDSWWDTDDSFKMYSWNATSKLWVAKQLGTNAFADLSISNAKIGAVDAGKISTGFLDVANRIEADSIGVEKVLIGSNDNVIPDPLFTNKANDWGAASSYYQFPSAEGRDGKSAFRIGPNTLQSGRYCRRIPATGGESYRIKVWVKSDVAIPAGALGIYRGIFAPGSSTRTTTTNILRRADGVSAGNDAIAANTWTLLSATDTLVDATTKLPLNMSGMTYGFFTQTSMTSTGTVWWSEASANRMGDGSLLVDGEIEGRHVKSDSMETRHFQADSVLMKHLAITDFTNYAPNLNTQASDWILSNGTTIGDSTLSAEGKRFIFPVTALAQARAPYIGVTAGETIRIEFSTYATSASNALELCWFGQTGKGASAGSGVIYKHASGATSVSRVWTVPATVAKVAFTIRVPSTANAAATGAYLFTVRKMAGGEMIVDGALDAKLITGAKIQTVAAANRGITLDGLTNLLTAWNTTGIKTFELNGNTGDVMFTGDYYSDVAGKPRVRISSTLYSSGYAGMTFEADGTSSGRVAGIKTSTAADYWKGALFLTSATYPDNGYNTNMSEMRLASDRINYFVNGPAASQVALHEMDATGYIATTTFLSGGSINQENRNNAGALTAWSSQSLSKHIKTLYSSTGQNKAYFSIEPDEILLSWAGTSTTALYNPNAYVWMHNTGGIPKVAFSLGTTGVVEMPRLRLTATNDAAIGSTLHALEIGDVSSQTIKFDANEIMSTDANNLYTKILVAGGFYVDNATYTMTSDSHMMTLGTYKKWIDPTILGTQNLDSMTATGDYAQDQNVDATLARKYPTTLAGLLEVRNPLGAVMIYQRYTTYDSTQKMYTRTKYNSTWTAWVQH